MRLKYRSSRLVQMLRIKEIARHGEEVCPPCCRFGKESIELLHREKRAEMHVADLSDHQPIRLRREIPYGDTVVTAHGHRPLDECAVAAEQCSRRRIECGTFQHAPPCRAVRDAAQPAACRTHENGEHRQEQRDDLRNVAEEDRQGDHPRPALRPMRGKKEEHRADAEDIKEDDRRTRCAQPPSLHQVPQEKYRQPCDQGDGRHEDQNKDGQMYLPVKFP